MIEHCKTDSTKNTHHHHNKDVSIEQIAQANHSVILLVTDKNSGSQKVSKVVRHSAKQHQRQCHHLNNEYHKLLKLQHPNIIRVLAHHVDSLDHLDTPCCALDLEVCKTDIFTYIQQVYPVQLGFGFLLRIFKATASALLYLHEKHQCVHLDIKPENILLKHSDEIVLSDFGFCQRVRKLKEASYIQKVWHQRSKMYQPPEILELCEVIDTEQKPEEHSSAYKEIDYKKVDVFQLGATIFSIFFLMHPYRDVDGTLNTQRQAKLSKKSHYESFWQSHPQIVQISSLLSAEGGECRFQAVKQLLFQMMSPNPKQRPSMKEILDTSILFNK